MTRDLLQPARLAATAADVQPATLRQWVRRGHINPPINGLYNLTEIEAHSARRDASTRYQQALAARRRRHNTCKTGHAL